MTIEEILASLSEEDKATVTKHIDQERTNASKTAASNTEKKLKSDEKFINQLKSEYAAELTKTSEEKLQAQLKVMQHKQNKTAVKEAFVNKGLTVTDEELEFYVRDTEEDSVAFANTVIGRITTNAQSMLEIEKNKLTAGMANPGINSNLPNINNNDKYNSQMKDAIKEHDFVSAVTLARLQAQDNNNS